MISHQQAIPTGMEKAGALERRRTEDLLIQVMIDQSVLTERITQIEEQLAGVTAKSIKAEISQVENILTRLRAVTS